MTRSAARTLAALFALGLAAATGAGVAVSTPAPESRGSGQVDLIEIDGSINPAVSGFIDDSIARARRDGAGALVIELDTPGGLLTSAQHIVKSLLGAPVAVIVYVAPAGASAASAGTFITEAANIAAMAPGTTIGAAHPVEMGGENVTGAMGQKLENFTVSFGRGIARERGRNEDWMEQAVRHSAAIGESEALQKHVIDIVAPDGRRPAGHIAARRGDRASASHDAGPALPQHAR
jgi:membrane-bound serine protease (ClpP class)